MGVGLQGCRVIEFRGWKPFRVGGGAGGEGGGGFEQWGAVSCSAASLDWRGNAHVCFLGGGVWLPRDLLDVGVGKVCARREGRPLGRVFVRRGK